MGRGEFFSAIGAFLASLPADQHDHRALAAVSEDDDLYRLGLLDSLGILRLVTFVEELTGRDIELEDHDFGALCTLRGLYSVAI